MLSSCSLHLIVTVPSLEGDVCVTYQDENFRDIVVNWCMDKNLLRRIFRCYECDVVSAAVELVSVSCDCVCARDYW